MIELSEATRRIKLRIDHILNRRPYTIDPQTGCWLWGGATVPKGYGHTTIRGVGGFYIHRLVAHKYLGLALDSPLLVLHHCDNPRCFNPDHLFIGTHSDNIRDCITKGRFNRNGRARGERVNTAKVTPEDVRAIRKAAERGETYNAIGKQFGLSGRQASNIANRRSWRHVS